MLLPVDCLLDLRVFRLRRSHSDLVRILGVIRVVVDDIACRIRDLRAVRLSGNVLGEVCALFDLRREGHYDILIAVCLYLILCQRHGQRLAMGADLCCQLLVRQSSPADGDGDVFPIVKLQLVYQCVRNDKRSCVQRHLRRDRVGEALAAVVQVGMLFPVDCLLDLRILCQIQSHIHIFLSIQGEAGLNDAIHRRQFIGICHRRGQDLIVICSGYIGVDIVIGIIVDILARDDQASQLLLESVVRSRGELHYIVSGGNAVEEIAAVFQLHAISAVRIVHLVDRLFQIVCSVQSRFNGNIRHQLLVRITQTVAVVIVPDQTADGALDHTSGYVHLGGAVLVCSGDVVPVSISCLVIAGRDLQACANAALCAKRSDDDEGSCLSVRIGNTVGTVFVWCVRYGSLLPGYTAGASFFDLV